MWFYHEWLMSIYTTTPTSTSSPSTTTTTVTTTNIIPDLIPSEKKTHLVKQLDLLTDMLDGAEDCKWIYEALLRYTLALQQLRREHEAAAAAAADVHVEAGTGDSDGDVDGDVDGRTTTRNWLVQLRRLDPLRKGRWDDLEKSLLAGRMMGG